MDIHSRKCHLTRLKLELDSKSYMFMENDYIISTTNLFQHLHICKNYLNEILNLYYISYLVRNFQIIARNKLRAKCLLNIFTLYKVSS